MAQEVWATKGITGKAEGSKEKGGEKGREENEGNRVTDPRENILGGILMAVDPVTGQEVPAGTQGEGVAITPQPPMPPLDEAHMVTVPGAAPPEDEGVFEVKARGETHKMSKAEVLEYASKGFDYTQKTQELAPYREMRDFIEDNPGAADAIVQLMQQGVPQQQAQQMVQQQAAPQGYPQQQQPVDPSVDFLLNQVAELQFNMQSDQFTRNHPDAKLEEVAQYMLDHGKDSLEDSYRDMTYPELARQAELYRQANLAQNQANAVEPGAQGPPDQIRVDPRTLKPDQISEIAKRYNFIE